jgi:hypothetical protein
VKRRSLLQAFCFVEKPESSPSPFGWIDPTSYQPQPLNEGGIKMPALKMVEMRGKRVEWGVKEGGKQ